MNKGPWYNLNWENKGVKEKIKVDGRLKVKGGRYYYAVDKNGSKMKGVFSEGDVFSVFLIKNWEKLE